MSKIKKLNTNKEYYRERSDEININTSAEEKKTAEKIIEKLRDYLRNHPGLVALAAPQIGYKYRIFCMKFKDNDIRTFINPLIMARKEMFFNEEVQIGFDWENDTYFVPRYREITAGYQTPVGAVEMNVFKDASSAVFEQMVHLLDGVFISDFGLFKEPGFDEATDEEKKEIFEMYMQNTLNNKESIEKIISESADDEQIDKMTKYYTDCLTGKIEILPMTEEEKQQILENKKKQAEEKKDA